jgi:predicted TPR repeat methyltransferase
MCYVSDIAPVLTEVKRVLTSGGVFAFTLETHDGDGVVIGEGLRYAHGKKIVRDSVVAVGLGLTHLEEASPRTEDNQPVRGLVVVAVKRDTKT